MPTLFDADRKSVERARDRDLERLRARTASARDHLPGARRRHLRRQRGRAHGADSMCRLVIPGQAAHLGIGRAADEPVLLARPPVRRAGPCLTISCDQRAAGPEASRRAPRIARRAPRDADPTDGLTRARCTTARSKRRFRICHRSTSTRSRSTLRRKRPGRPCSRRSGARSTTGSSRRLARVAGLSRPDRRG